MITQKKVREFLPLNKKFIDIFIHDWWSIRDQGFHEVVDCLKLWGACKENKCNSNTIKMMEKIVKKDQTCQKWLANFYAGDFFFHDAQQSCRAGNV